eukprot:CAMPEP_0204126656 /NCGR_PEP_ID=MMETSP0361-20130328/11130_1 /ASSEMBLY_ACC=CAM_ASM_000343 /TAXON_ID=268821 /ORGANISM="Scrippsiella Hangoei, Strain SHTV-5" /LENGTH=39 /DNA_ID= /DNA_START= /DNA_END= /DNA_ORIENTATION=
MKLTMSNHMPKEKFGGSQPLVTHRVAQRLRKKHVMPKLR